MAVAFVQHIGETEYKASASTTSALSVSKTVTAGNLIVVGICYYGALGSNESATDNLGNTYTFREHAGNGTTTNTAILTAPVTVGGTLTTITVTHSSRQYRTVMAAELSGVGAYSVAGAGSSGSGTTSTWVNNKTIPANGVAFGFVGSNTTDVMSAGSSSGSPSTSITRDTHYASPGSGSMSIGDFYAIAGGSNVTSFSGTATHASISWSSAGVVFSPVVATSASAGSASGTGAALGIDASIKPRPANASATGTARQPAASVKPSPASAAATGAARQPGASIKATAGTASATGTAHDATASTAAADTAPADPAAATGAANRPSASVKPSAGTASATGAAHGTDAGVKPSAGQSSATGAAWAPAGTVATTAGAAAAVGAAHDATVTTATSDTANPSTATATATAHDATVTTSGTQPIAPAGGSRRRPRQMQDPDDEEAALVMAVLRHRLRL